jgi:hypothetical protein
MGTKIKSDGGSTAYYRLPEGAAELFDLIEHKNMNFAVGEAFKALYRLDEKDGSDACYDLRKVIFCATRELERRLRLAPPPQTAYEELCALAEQAEGRKDEKAPEPISKPGSLGRLTIPHPDACPHGYAPEDDCGMCRADKLRANKKSKSPVHREADDSVQREGDESA